jgi:hypothetical protein
VQRRSVIADLRKRLGAVLPELWNLTDSLRTDDMAELVRGDWEKGGFGAFEM